MTPQVIAFGGWLYPIAKWLPSFVRHYASPLFGFSVSWCRSLARSIDRPTVLIGFSAGATAAMHVASHSPMIRTAIVHSCEFAKYQIGYLCEYRFFATIGDTTPTRPQTRQTFEDVANRGATATLDYLPFVPFASPTFFERRQLERRKHIFHNVLPRIGPIIERRAHAPA